MLRTIDIIRVLVSKVKIEWVKPVTNNKKFNQKSVKLDRFRSSYNFEMFNKLPKIITIFKFKLSEIWNIIQALFKIPSINFLELVNIQLILQNQPPNIDESLRNFFYPWKPDLALHNMFSIQNQ